MTISPRARLVNPRLGTYFGIVASALAGLVLLVLLFEQLGTSSVALRLVMLLLPAALYIGIGAAALTREPTEYFAAGRRVPAAYSGLVLALTALGSTGIVAIAGEFFIVGYDVLCIVVGAVTGFVVMAILLAPFLRKFGAFTLPSYLGRRFDSGLLRVVAALVLAVPTAMMLGAELRMGALALTRLFDIGQSQAVALLLVILLATLGAGGMRSSTWSGVAQGMLALGALLVPLAIVGVLETNLPIPQFSHGPAAKHIWRMEQMQGFPNITASDWTFELGGQGFHAMAKKLVSPFANVGRFAYLAVMISVMAGVATAPWLLPRVATAPGVHEARKSLAWATFYFGVIITSITSAGVFMRERIMELAAAQTTTLPDWLKHLIALGFADIDRSVATFKAQSVSIDRDSLLPALSTVYELPPGFLYLIAAGVLAAALAAAGSALVALGNMLAEDIAGGLAWDAGPGERRVWFGRAALVVAAVLGGVATAALPADPVKPMLWALAVTASSAFPVLVLSIWWKRINTFGALASMVAGFTVALLAILIGDSRLFGFDSPLAAVFGLPASLIAAIATSLLTPAPGRHLLELVRDIRVPGGEILYDRELRIARLKQRQQK